MHLDKIVIVDDEMVVRRSLEEHLRRRRYVVASVPTLAEAEALLAKDSFDLILLDVRLPDGDGTRLLKQISGRPESPAVVMMTGYGTIESAVECMRLGAFDYIVKPFSIDQIEVLMKKVESYQQLVRLNQYYSSPQTDEDRQFLGRSPTMVNLKKLVKKVAATEATVLVTGENGTGKEMVAREIHAQSNRAAQPYIKVNCAAISENLIESEFFGHEKGSFTGALQRRVGRFELANNGTILLDEIGEISPAIQVKLLRVLQEREFERVGGDRTIRVNVRVVATTNRDLTKAIQRGDFREDLYYRLNVFPLVVPPLRERPDDIEMLAEHFLERFARKHGVHVRGLSPAARARLRAHPWPGNVRELQNTIERATILTEDNTALGEAALGLPPLPGAVAFPDVPISNDAPQEPNVTAEPAPAAIVEAPAPAAASPVLGSSAAAFTSLDDLERQHILEALRRTQGRKKEAADLLRISDRTLRNKLQQYREEGISIPHDGLT